MSFILDTRVFYVKKEHSIKNIDTFVLHLIFYKRMKHITSLTIYCCLLLATCMQGHSQEKMVTTNYNENLPTETLPAPIIEVATSTDGGRYMRITMFCETADAEIHYTLDGTIPTKQSPLYTEEITGNSHSVTIKAITTKDGYLDSPIAEYMYGGSGIINEQTDKKIISRIYLPLSGTPLFSPTEGMNIVITTYEDGQLETHKMIWKP